MENLVNSEKLDRFFWNNKKILVTGHTGFKGSWLTICLNALGADVHGISLKPTLYPSLFESACIFKLCNSIFCDIRNYDELRKNIKIINPDVILHLAAQPLVKESYEDPLKTYSTNIMGSINILNISREIKNLKSIIVITTDKVYKNREWSYAYRENDELGGFDPYSSSKAALEIIINSYRESYFKKQGVSIYSARAGNVIGGGDWSKYRLIPDLVRAWESNELLEIRRPYFIRPWQHVLESLYGYLLLTQISFEKDDLNNAYNFGPDTSESLSVKEVIELTSKFFKNTNYRFNEADSFHETGKLILDNSLVKNELGYLPRWNINKSIEKTINWYKNFYQGMDAYELCLSDIKDFNF